MKMPGVKMPSVKMPKIKGPQGGISLPKVEGDVSVPKLEAQLPEGEVSIKTPEAEGSIEGGGMKIHMPKFKMPSMGFSKPDVKAPKVDVDLSTPKVDAKLPSTDLSLSGPDLKSEKLAADISITAPEVKLPRDQISMEIKVPDLQIKAPSPEIAVPSGEVKVEGMDGKFKMPKFQMSKFGVSLPKGKAAIEGDITIPSVEVEIPKAELKGEVTVPSVETALKMSGPEIEAPSVEVEVGEKDKMKMPGVKMPSVKMPKIKGPQVDISLPKVKGDVSVPKLEAQLAEGEVSVKKSEAEGSIEGGGMKIHMPKFKMPSMGFSKPDVKVPKVDVDLNAPKVDAKLPSADLSLSGPDLTSEKLAGDISVTAPEVKLPGEQISMEIKAPDLEIKAPSPEIAVASGEVKVEGVDGKFKMPKFQMPKFGVSLPKGKATIEGDITVPSVEAEIPKTDPKVEVTMPSVDMGITVSGPEFEAPSVEVEVGEKGKMKMPGVKMPSVKMPKIKGPQVDISLPKVEGDVSIPKVEAEMPEGEVSIKTPEAEGSIKRGGMKVHMPKFKMPSMGFSKRDVKAPEVDVDLSAPKVDVKLPSTDVSTSKSELETGDLAANISISSPEVKIPIDETSMELKAPDLQIGAPSAEVAVEGREVKLEGVDGKFQMPKFHMPKFGISFPKGKATIEGDVTIPSVEAEIPRAELKGEVTVPSVETVIKVSGPEIEAPSVEGEVGEKMPVVKMPVVKMPVVKMPSVKMPKVKGPQVGISLPKVEGDVSVSKDEAELPEGKVSIIVPEAEGTIEEGKMKIHMPKFKMPSMGFSRPDIKDPKVDMDLSVASPDITLPSADVRITKPDLDPGEFAADLSVSAPEMKIPAGQAPEFQLDAPSSEIALKDVEAKVEGGDGKFKMPKFQMPKFGISFPKGKAAVDGDITIPPVESEIPEAEMKGEITLPSLEMGIKMSGPHIEAPSMEGEFREKTLEISSEGLSGDTDFSAAEIHVEGSKGKMKMPKFHMPKFGLSRTKEKVIEGKISTSKADIDLPGMDTDVQILDIRTIEVPEIESDVSDFKMPTSPEKALQPPKTDIHVSGLPSVDVPVSQTEVNIQGTDLDIKGLKMETSEKDTTERDSKFKMPKFKLPSFNWSPKKEASVSGHVDANWEDPSLAISTSEREPELTLTVEAIVDEAVEVDDSHISVDKDSERGKMRRPQFSMPKFSLPKMKGHKAEMTVSQLETDVSVFEHGEKGDRPLQIHEKEISGEDAKKSVKMPKLPSLELSKPEIKAPKVDMKVSLSKSDAQMPTSDVSLSKPEVHLGDVGPDVSIAASEIKGSVAEELKGPEVKMEGQFADICVDGSEIKIEVVEGKTKKPKFQMPKFGISFSRGKVPDTEVTLPSMEAEVPQLKTTTDIADIAVEALALEADYAVAGGEAIIVDEKVRIPQVPKGVKTPALDIKLPSAGLSMPPSEKDIQSSEAVSKEEKPEGDLKTGVLDTEEKEGHFKMPKFKLPSFSRSPKKEASLTADVKEPLEEPQTTILEETDSELTVVLSEDQGVQMDIDAEMSSKKGQVKRPHFVMPKFSLSKPKISKSQASLSKTERDITEEREGEVVQILDIESSLTTREGGTEISIKMPKGISKPEIKTPKADIDTKVLTADIKAPTTGRSSEQKHSDRGFEGTAGEMDMESAMRKTDGLEIRLPKLQMPKFGISVPEGEVPTGEIVMPVTKAEISQLQTIERLDGEAPILEVQAETADVELKGSFVKTDAPQIPTAEMKASDTSAYRLSEKDIDVEGEHEIQTEGSQGWFKMPKFKMPSFGRSSLKGKKGDDEDDGSLGKGLTADMQEVEVKAPETVPQSLHVDTESCSVEDSLEGKVTIPQGAIPEGGVSIQKEGGKGRLRQSSGKMDVKVSVEGSKTYAEAVKHGAEEQLQKTPFSGPRDELSSLEISMPKVDAALPKGDVAFQHEAKLDGAKSAEYSIDTKRVDVGTDEAASTEITVEGTELRTGVAGPKEGAVEQSRDAEVKTEKAASQIKSPKKDIQGKESLFKMPKFSVPSFGWSTPKSTGHITEDIPSLEEPEAAALPEVKMDVSITDEDFEIIELPIEGFEKDVSAEVEVKAEERDRASKTKASKFKMPKFGSLRSKSRGSEVLADPPKAEAEVSLAKMEGGESEIQSQGAEGAVDLESTKLDIAAKESEGSELSFHIPKLKIPKFTHSSPIAEGQVLTSEGTTVGKCVDTDGAPLLEFRTKVLEEKEDIQKSKVRITTLSEPAIQRTKLESKTSSKESMFSETAVRIQRPMEFSSGFPKDHLEAMGTTIHKSIAKITTLTEPDIQTTQLEITLPSADSFTPDVSVHVQGPCSESKETKIEGTSMLGYGSSQSQETFSTQIVRESEIPPSEIKTATYGFSLLKLKMQEPHLSVGVPVTCSSPEDVSETFESKGSKLKRSDESSGTAVQKTASLGFQVSEKAPGIAGDFAEGASSTTTLTKLKTVEVQSSTEFADSCSDKQSKEISVSAVSQVKGDTKPSETGEESTEQKEKSDGGSTSGRFKFWFPTIGFSSSVDDTTTESKAEDQTSSVEDAQPKDPSATDSDAAKQTGWFRFPKLGFSSPTKKVKEADKEVMDPKERKPPGEESPTEKTEMFFDAQESLPPKVAETEEISGTTSMTAIVSSSARTELILLEKEKATSQSIPEGPSK